MESNREMASVAGGKDAAAPSSLWLVLCRVSVLSALAASAALYLQYLRPAEAAFCGLESGCEAVRRAGFSYFFGSPLFSIPLVGLVAYAVVLWISLFAPEAPWTLWLTSVGAVGALGLLGAQTFVVHAFCWLCVAVDVSAVLSAAFAFAERRTRRQHSGNAFDPLKRGAWILLSGVAIAFPTVWTIVKPAPPVPASVRALYVPGKVNVVEFADFECPYCRRLHPVLKSVLHEYPAERLHFVRRHVPLPGHPDALPAARAAVCAEQQGLGEKLADKLVELELSPAADRR
ncbi:MAG TPA: vitamin K epoxide reductase family protein, partial [Polyangiaceae bacterium]